MAAATWSTLSGSKSSVPSLSPSWPSVKPAAAAGLVSRRRPFLTDVWLFRQNICVGDGGALHITNNAGNAAGGLGLGRHEDRAHTETETRSQIRFSPHSTHSSAINQPTRVPVANRFSSYSVRQADPFHQIVESWICPKRIPHGVRVQIR